MILLLLLSFFNLTLTSPTVYDIFIFTLERYLVKLITGPLASPAWYLFQITDLKEEISGVARGLSKCQQ